MDKKAKSSTSMSFEEAIKRKSLQLSSSSTSPHDRQNSNNNRTAAKTNTKGISPKKRNNATGTSTTTKTQKKIIKKKIVRTSATTSTSSGSKDDNDPNSKSRIIPSPTNKSSPSSSNSICCSNTLLQQTIIQIPKQYLLKILSNSIIQKVITIPLTLFLFILFKKIFLGHHSLEYFFTWMEQHPNKGMAAYLIIYPFHMILFLPGTPLVMGAGYIFKIRFGWLWGVSLCSVITLFGSLIGSIQCFLLGRYCMRGTVRRWSKKYPLFDPIDAAVSDNGFKIMSLLYLTPVIPLGPLSYVMGTTSMPLMSFAKAKIAALPLTVLYVYLGAATGTLVASAEEEENILDPSGGGSISSSGKASVSTAKKGMSELKVDPKLIVFGILFSIVSIAVISIKMKQELQKILDKQNDDKDIIHVGHDDHLGISKAGKKGGQTRQRLKAPRLSNKKNEDIELQRPLVSV